MDLKLLKRFKEIEKCVWELPKTYRKKMNVPVRVVATAKILQDLDDGAVEQAINVSELPGIIGASWMMPDAHWGYGFPIGGVAAFDVKKGVISPGGIGFDINCGMRLIITNLTESEVKPKIKLLIDELFDLVPTGVGASGTVRLSTEEFKKVLVKGASWAVENGFGWPQDLEKIEENGVISFANPEVISNRAVQRGINQLGTLGSGNHYLEIQKVDRIFDYKIAKEFGIQSQNQIAAMIHCGSRGFGHQVCSDFLAIFELGMKKYSIKVSDKQLACVPFESEEGKKYFSAMACAANNAFCNRQVITHRVREAFEKVFSKSSRELGMSLVYDVAHNIAKIESFKVADKDLKVVVHRKGATRSYPGQPVIIGGSMETGSYLLTGIEASLSKTFGSTAHGSGRVMSRTKAKKLVEGKALERRMRESGIYVKAASYSGLSEEAGFAYKDISEVVQAVTIAGISRPIVSLKPLGNIKG